MISAIIIAGAITICIRELDPAIQKQRQNEILRKRQFLFLK